MACPECGADVVAFSVPSDLRTYVPGEEPVVAICTRCLSLSPATDPDDAPDFSRIADTFPEDEAAVPMALLVGLLDSLALHRAEITALLERVERTGVDPLLVLDRLTAWPGTDPAVDLQRRRHQLEQLL